MDFSPFSSFSLLIFLWTVARCSPAPLPLFSDGLAGRRGWVRGGRLVKSSLRGSGSRFRVVSVFGVLPVELRLPRLAGGAW